MKTKQKASGHNALKDILKTEKYEPKIDTSQYKVLDVTPITKMNNELWVLNLDTGIESPIIAAKKFRARPNHILTTYNQVFPSGHTIIDKFYNQRTKQQFDNNLGLPRLSCYVLYLSCIIGFIPILGAMSCVISQNISSGTNKNINIGFDKILYKMKFFPTIILVLIGCFDFIPKESISPSTLRFLVLSLLLTHPISSFYFLIALIMRFKPYLENKKRIERLSVNQATNQNSDYFTKESQCSIIPESDPTFISNTDTVYNLEEYKASDLITNFFASYSQYLNQKSAFTATLNSLIINYNNLQPQKETNWLKKCAISSGSYNKQLNEKSLTSYLIYCYNKAEELSICLQALNSEHSLRNNTDFSPNNNNEDSTICLAINTKAENEFSELGNTYFVSRNKLYKSLGYKNKKILCNFESKILNNEITFWPEPLNYMFKYSQKFYDVREILLALILWRNKTDRKKMKISIDLAILDLLDSNLYCKKNSKEVVEYKEFIDNE